VTPKAVLKAILAAIVVAAVALYAGDFAWFEYRMQNAKPNDPLETMTFYYATDIKGGKVEVFDDQPQTAICVHSIFPHGGYKPCWRFGRGFPNLVICMPGETLVVEGMNIVSKVFQQGCEPEGKVLVQLDIHLM
jgi:hypothetical protein